MLGLARRDGVGDQARAENGVVGVADKDGNVLPDLIPVSGSISTAKLISSLRDATDNTRTPWARAKKGRRVVS